MNKPFLLLTRLGLSEPEAQIYLSCLKLGSGPVSTIARHADMKRLAAHNALKSLYKKGLSSTFENKGVTRYAVVSLGLLQEKLLQELEEKRNLIGGLEKSIQKSVDFSQTTFPEVVMYQGLEGMKTVYEQTLQNSDYIYAFIGPDKQKDKMFLDRMYDTYIDRRNTHISDIKTIFHPEPYERYRGQYETRGRKWKSERVKVIEQDILPLTGGMIIYGERNVLISSYQFQGMCAHVVSNNTYHASMKGLFEYVWERTK